MMRILAVASLFLLANSIHAQQPVARAGDHQAQAPRATAARLDGTICIDGSLNEAQWRSAQPLSAFTGASPDNIFLIKVS